MAKGLTLGNYIDKPKKKRPGVHAKSKTSKIKNSKNDIVRNGPSISSGTWDKLKLGIRNGDVINLYGTSFF